jgi:hypothetical protein
MRTREEIAWAAGLFEGEGCIAYAEQITSGKRYGYPRVSLAMTDLDVLEHFKQVLGFGNITPQRRYAAHHKPSWVWSAAGFQWSQALVAMFWPWLGNRRRSRAIDVLTRPVGRLSC